MYEMLVGLDVIDDQVYQRYRQAMRPILESYGGEFGYDFRVSEVLKNESEEDINRVFTIRFPTEKAQESFFADTDYQAVKAEFFDASVKSINIIAGYSKP